MTKTKLEYQQVFVTFRWNSAINTFQEWAEYYKKILNWEIKFDKVLTMSLQIYTISKEEANIQFSNL